MNFVTLIINASTGGQTGLIKTLGIIFWSTKLKVDIIMVSARAKSREGKHSLQKLYTTTLNRCESIIN